VAHRRARSALVLARRQPVRRRPASRRRPRWRRWRAGARGSRGNGVVRGVCARQRPGRDGQDGGRVRGHARPARLAARRRGPGGRRGRHGRDGRDERRGRRARAASAPGGPCRCRRARLRRSPLAAAAARPHDPGHAATTRGTNVRGRSGSDSHAAVTAASCHAAAGSARARCRTRYAEPAPEPARAGGPRRRGDRSERSRGRRRRRAGGTVHGRAGRDPGRAWRRARRVASGAASRAEEPDGRERTSAEAPNERLESPSRAARRDPGVARSAGRPARRTADRRGPRAPRSAKANHRAVGFCEPVRLRRDRPRHGRRDPPATAGPRSREPSAARVVAGPRRPRSPALRGAWRLCRRRSQPQALSYH
jgi:hypothetical protein